jgi:hypothetical protein
MKRVIIGTVILGLVLYIFPGTRSGPACLAAGLLSTLLLLWFGPRSIVEKVGVLMAVSLVAWVAGPRAAGRAESLPTHLFGWLAGGAALSFYLHPRSE